MAETKYPCERHDSEITHIHKDISDINDTLKEHSDKIQEQAIKDTQLEELSKRSIEGQARLNETLTGINDTQLEIQLSLQEMNSNSASLKVDVDNLNTEVKQIKDGSRIDKWKIFDKVFWAILGSVGAVLINMVISLIK